MKNEKGFTIIELLVVVFMIFAVGISIFAVGISIYGAVLAFKASIILGIIVLVVEPSPFIIGLVALFGTNVAEALQNWIKFPV